MAQENRGLARAGEVTPDQLLNLQRQLAENAEAVAAVEVKQADAKAGQGSLLQIFAGRCDAIDAAVALNGRKLDALLAHFGVPIPN